MTVSSVHRWNGKNYAGSVTEKIEEKETAFDRCVAQRGHSLRPDDDMAAIRGFVLGNEGGSVALEIVD